MNRNINDVLKAINMASYDNVNELTVTIDDLCELRSTIIVHSDRVQALEKENTILRSKLALKELEKPIRLDTYC